MKSFKRILVSLALVGFVASVPAVSNDLQEAGSGGVRSAGGAEITIAGATWNSNSATAATNIQTAITSMTGAYVVNCPACPVPDLPSPWVCNFFNLAGTVPARVVCTVTDPGYDISGTVTYTLAPWIDDAGVTWTTTTLIIHQSKGTSLVSQDPTVINPATRTVSESPQTFPTYTYVGGTATVPYTVLGEDVIVSGNEKLFITLLGETWNTLSKWQTTQLWTDEIVFSAQAGGNSFGFNNLRNILLPPHTVVGGIPPNFVFTIQWNTAGTGVDVLEITFQAAPTYSIHRHEVINIVLSNSAVTSLFPGGAPASLLAFEIWPTIGTVNMTSGVSPMIVTEDDIRAGGVTFDLTISGETWDPSFRWELFREVMVSDRTVSDEPAGWEARKSVTISDPLNIQRISDSIVRVTLHPDASYDATRAETITFEFMGCDTYQKIRVLPLNEECNPKYLTRSHLIPNSVTVELQILTSPGDISIDVTSATECDIRAGLSITITLVDEDWNFADYAAVRTEFIRILSVDASFAFGFNAQKNNLIRPTDITFPNTRMMTINIGPSTSYDIHGNETIDFPAILNRNPLSAPILFRSSTIPIFSNGTTNVLTIEPGPCVIMDATTSCNNPGTCGSGLNPTCDCFIFTEDNLQNRQAFITLTLPYGDLWNIALPLADLRYEVSTRLQKVKHDSGHFSDQNTAGATADRTNPHPWGFQARKNMVTNFVTVTRLSNQQVRIQMGDAGYEIPDREEILLYIPGSWTASGSPPLVSNGMTAVAITINRVTPVVTMTPNPLEIYDCDIRGPAYNYLNNRASGTTHTLIQSDRECASRSIHLGVVNSTTECAQLCFASSTTCQYFTFRSDNGRCELEMTSSTTCPEGLLTIAGSDFFQLRIPVMSFSLELDDESWMTNADEIREYFSPPSSTFVQKIDSLLPAGSISFTNNNTVNFQLSRATDFLISSPSEDVTFTVGKRLISCGCQTSPSLFTFRIQRCPSLVFLVNDDDAIITEQQIWDGTANITIGIEGDFWKDTASLQSVTNFAQSFRPVDIPAATWSNHLSCVFRRTPVVSDDLTQLTIPLGPCPEFDINTDSLGNFGNLALTSNESVYFTVPSEFVASGVAPVGGNQIGWQQSVPESRIYLNITASEGWIRVFQGVPNYFEDDVQNGLYTIDLILNKGESFIPPTTGDSVATYLRQRTTTVNPQPSGSGWNFLNTVLVNSITIDPNDPQKITVIWNSIPAYNIDVPEQLCIDFSYFITASGLQPKFIEDGGYCIRPPEILPNSGCVEMEPFPYTITEEEIRTTGLRFDLVLTRGERWVNNGLLGGFNSLINNMSVLNPPDSTSDLYNAMGWENRKIGYSAAAFELDSTKTRLSVRIPGDAMGNQIADPLFDIVTSEVIQITIPETIVGSGRPPCVLTPNDGSPLYFNITPVTGSVSMIETIFTEGDIRQSGGTVAITLTGDTWTDPWDITEKQLAVASLVTVCRFDEMISPGWTPNGYPDQRDSVCNYEHGFDTYRTHSTSPLVNITLLEFQNNRLEIILNPTPEYDIPYDELVVIRFPQELFGSRAQPENWNRLWFLIRASRSMIANQPELIKIPGITENEIRQGIAPPIRVGLFYETWDITEEQLLLDSFCGSSGDCNDVVNVNGFNALRNRLFRGASIVRYEDEAGQVCPPNCPATVAVVRFAAVPEFDVCENSPETIMVLLEPLSVTSHPRFSPTPWGIGSPDELGFNITAVGGSGNPIYITTPLTSVAVEEDIRGAGVTVTLSVSDGAWSVNHPNFLGLLRQSIESTLPSLELFSHAGSLLFDLFPNSISDLTFTSDNNIPNRHMEFTLRSPYYDIPQHSPADCVNINCPFLQPTQNDNTLMCNNGQVCNTVTNGAGCCSTRGGKKQCPLNFSFMCGGPSMCNGDYCCSDTAAGCALLGGVRQCSANLCQNGEKLFFNINPELTTCGAVPPRTTLNLQINGRSWDIERWSTPMSTFEAEEKSQYATEEFLFEIFGTELHSTNDSASISYISSGVGCHDGLEKIGQFNDLYIPSGSTIIEGPGHTQLQYRVTPVDPGIYNLCYKDFRDSSWSTTPGVHRYRPNDIVTVIGRVFTMQSDWDLSEMANVTIDDEPRRITFGGKGFCFSARDAAERGFAGPQQYGHNDVGSCDSIKVMEGDSDCNPGYPSLDDRTGRYTPAIPLRSDTQNDPTTGYVDIVLKQKGTFTVCYLSGFARYWQRVSLFNVTAAIHRWDACNPEEYDTRVWHRSFLASKLYSPYSSLPCNVRYEALAGVPQRIFFKGAGLTSTTAIYGDRSKQRIYQFLGSGKCTPSDIAIPVRSCTVDNVMKPNIDLPYCQRLCDRVAYCDSVAFGFDSSLSLTQCFLYFASVPNPNVQLSHEDLRCTITAGTDRVIGSISITPAARFSCYNRTLGEDINDVGDRVKVIKFGDDCETSSSPGEGILDQRTPAIQYVDSDPVSIRNRGFWDAVPRTCIPPFNRCVTPVTDAVWIFNTYGRYSFCYNFKDTSEWVLVPDTNLVVWAEITSISPDRLPARSDRDAAPTVQYIGTGILNAGFNARLREWPDTCTSPPRHPGVIGYGWEEDVFLDSGVPLYDQSFNTPIPTQAISAPVAPFLVGFQRVLAQSNWTFSDITTNGQNVANLPHWWTQSGEYLFCYQLPGLTDWRPVGYVTVYPVPERISPSVLVASPTMQEVTLEGTGFDSRVGMDYIKFVPAALGTCSNSRVDISALVIQSPKLTPDQVGLDNSGNGLRGLTTITTSGQSFAVAGLYRACYGYGNATEQYEFGIERECRLYPKCSAFTGLCCPNEHGIWHDCCERDQSIRWMEVPSSSSCDTTGQVDYPNGWPDWFTANRLPCVEKDNVPGYNPAAPPMFPPCPEFYCGMLSVYPVVGSMIVENHPSLNGPPVLETDVAYDIRFDGQGFSEGDYAYWISGHQSNCGGIEPFPYANNPNKVQLQPDPGSPGTPWHLQQMGVPRILMRNHRFPDFGDYTICLSFQLYPGLFIAAGNLTVVNKIAQMEWKADDGINLRIDFNGGGLRPLGGDRAMIIRFPGSTCDPSNAILTTQPGDLKGGGVGRAYWEVPPQTLTVGMYQTCYLLKDGDGQWQLLDNFIEFPFGNVQPGFQVHPEPTAFGSSDDVHYYGPPGTTFSYNLPFARNITTAATLPPSTSLLRETRQTVRFEVRALSSPLLFQSRCVPIDMRCVSPPLLTESECTQNQCSWNGIKCSRLVASVCETFPRSLCVTNGCKWAEGTAPSVDATTGRLTFVVADVSFAGVAQFQVVLKDDGGTERGGIDTSEVIPVSITITSGPDFIPVNNVVTLLEDETYEATNQPIVAFSVSKIDGRDYKYTVQWNDPTLATTFFAGGFNVSDTGYLVAVPSPDRWTDVQGIPFDVTLTDRTVGVSVTQRLTAVILPINDPPYFELMSNFKTSPLYWRQGRVEKYSEKVLNIQPAGSPCRTLEAVYCVRIFVGYGGCSGNQLPDTKLLKYDCTQYLVTHQCAVGVCTTSVDPCAPSSVGKSCIASHITQNCSNSFITPECSAVTDCINRACSAANDSSLSYGVFEDEQTAKFTVNIIAPRTAADFEELPEIDQNGILTFIASPVVKGNIMLTIVMIDDGGTERGGVNNFTSPDPIRIQTYEVPTLVVDPPTGVSLEQDFQLRAEGGTLDANNWQFTFTTIPNSVTNPADLSDSKAISHSHFGPSEDRIVTTKNLPAGTHTVVLQIFEDGKLIDTVQTTATISSPPANRIQEAVLGQGGPPEKRIETLAAVAVTLEASKGNGPSPFADTLLQNVRGASDLLQSPNGNTISNTLVALNSALGSIGEGEGQSGTLSTAVQSFGILRRKATGEGSVVGDVQLTGTLAGLSKGNITRLEEALKVDLTAAFQVNAKDLLVKLTENPANGKLSAHYVIAAPNDDTDAVQSRIVMNRQVLLTQSQLVYKQLRDGSPAIDYLRSQTSSTASGSIILNEKNVVNQSDPGVAGNLIADIAQSLGTTPGKVSLTVTSLPGSESLIRFTVDVTDDPTVSGVLQCALVVECTAQSLMFPSTSLYLPGPGTISPNISKSEYSFETATTLFINDLSLRAITDVQITQIKTAILADLTESHFGINDPAKLFVTYSMDPSTGGSKIDVRVNMTGVTNPVAIQRSMRDKLLAKNLVLSRTRDAMQGMTVEAADLRSPTTTSIPLEGSMLEKFMRSSSAIIMSASPGPIPWTSVNDRDSVKRNSTERSTTITVLSQQLEETNRLIDLSCTTLLQQAISTGDESRSISTNQPAFVIEWRPMFSRVRVPQDNVFSSLALNPGSPNGIIVNRPNRHNNEDTCIVTTAYRKNPFLSNGEPGKTPDTPVVSIRAKGLRVLPPSSTSIPVSQSQDIEVILWDNVNKNWHYEKDVTLKIKTNLQGEVTILAESTGELLGSDPFRVFATAPQPVENPKKCLACYILPIVIGTWLLLCAAGAALHKKMTVHDTELEEGAKLLHAVNRTPTFGSAIHKHHAWLCYFPKRPTVVQFYTRWERATVWFVTNFVATGMVAILFSSNSISAWENPPKVDYTECILFAVLALLAGWIPSLGLRYLLTARERNWRENLKVQDVYIPKKYDDDNLDELGYENPKYTKPQCSFPYYGFVVVYSLAMLILCATQTGDYNTNNQVEQYVITFTSVVILHFFIEFIWVFLMYKMENAYWKSPNHPRHKMLEKKETRVQKMVVMPSFSTGDARQKKVRAETEMLDGEYADREDIPFNNVHYDSFEDKKHIAEVSTTPPSPAFQSEVVDEGLTTGIDWNRIHTDFGESGKKETADAAEVEFENLFKNDQKALPPSAASPSSLRSRVGPVSRAFIEQNRYSDPDSSYPSQPFQVPSAGRGYAFDSVQSVPPPPSNPLRSGSGITGTDANFDGKTSPFLY